MYTGVAERSEFHREIHAPFTQAAYLLDGNGASADDAGAPSPREFRPSRDIFISAETIAQSIDILGCPMLQSRFGSRGIRNETTRLTLGFFARQDWGALANWNPDLHPDNGASRFSQSSRGLPLHQDRLRTTAERRNRWKCFPLPRPLEAGG